MRDCGTCKYEPEWELVEGELNGFCRFPLPENLPTGTIVPVFVCCENRGRGKEYFSSRQIKNCPAYYLKEKPE